MTINNLTNQVLETILFKASNPESCFLLNLPRLKPWNSSNRAIRHTRNRCWVILSPRGSHRTHTKRTIGRKSLSTYCVINFLVLAVWYRQFLKQENLQPIGKYAKGMKRKGQEIDALIPRLKPWAFPLNVVSKRFNVASQNVINRVFYDIQIYHLDNQNLNGWDFTEWSLHDIFNQLRRLTSPDHTPESMPGISLQAYQFLSTLHTLRESTIIFWEIHAHDADEDVWLYDLPAAPLKVIQRGLTEWIENTELKYPLKMLDLSRTDITVLPTHVTQLTQLHTIDLRKTGIREGLDNAKRIPNILLTPPEELYWEPSTKPPNLTNLKRQKTWPSIE